MADFAEKDVDAENPNEADDDNAPAPVILY